MIKRRAATAGLSPSTCCHTFRATGDHGVAIHRAAQRCRFLCRVRVAVTASWKHGPPLGPAGARGEEVRAVESSRAAGPGSDGPTASTAVGPAAGGACRHPRSGSARRRTPGESTLYNLTNMDAGFWAAVLQHFGRREPKTPMAFYTRLIWVVVVGLAGGFYWEVDIVTRAYMIVPFFLLAVAVFCWVAYLNWHRPEHLLYGEHTHFEKWKLAYGTEQGGASKADLNKASGNPAG